MREEAVAKLVAPSSAAAVVRAVKRKPGKRALVDALIAARACVEMDWKTDAENIAAKIRRLKGVPRDAFAWMKRVSEIDDHSTWELLEMTGAELRKCGLQLAELDIDSDSYCLVVVPLADAKQLRAATKTAKVFGDQLAAARKQRMAQQRRDAREDKLEEEREVARPKVTLNYYSKGTAWRWAKAIGMRVMIRLASPKGSLIETHVYPTAARAKAKVSAEVAAWKASGFVRGREGKKYEDILAPFPEDARYFLEYDRVLRAISVDGDCVWTAGGAWGRTFGARPDFVYYASAKEAQAAADALVTQYLLASREITRARVVKRYSAESKAPVRHAELRRSTASRRG